MRSTNAETRRRIEFCLRLRLQGAEVWDLLELVRTDEDPKDPDGHGKAWRVTARTLYRYLDQADEILKEMVEKDREKNLNRHVVSRRLVYARLMQTGDNRGALHALDSEAKLLGLLVDKFEHSGQLGGGWPEGPVQVEYTTVTREMLEYEAELQRETLRYEAELAEKARAADANHAPRKRARRGKRGRRRPRNDH
jgi:hypothetical protein